jgi:L-aspartate oxidase
MTLIRPFGAQIPIIESSEVIVIGSGMAGMVAALQLSPRKVTLITKTPSLTGGSTAWAQGGIAAAIGDDDSPQEHAKDTLIAGAGLNDKAIVDILTFDGVDRLKKLIEAGAPFDRNVKGEIQLGREAAHKNRRIVHAGGDSTGVHIHNWLADAVSKEPYINVKTSTFAWELKIKNGRIAGVLVYQEPHGWVFLRSSCIVMATGGLGQLFQRTTNPLEATADGLAMAYRVGAEVADLEFVQFHPTALADPKSKDNLPMPLLTEALRGEGATLVDTIGKRFMLSEHPDGELAPRDVVARAIWKRLQNDKGAFLDLRSVFDKISKKRFPTVIEICRKAGFDPFNELIPIAPAAHYHMGGIVSDRLGRTSIEGLWACGEVAATGVHGANRLASNSLLEGLVFGYRVAEDIKKQKLPHHLNIDTESPKTPEIARKNSEVNSLTKSLRKTMYENVGLCRDLEGMKLAYRAHKNLAIKLTQFEIQTETLNPTLDMVRSWGELRNLTLAGCLITKAALGRSESRGAHYRIDFPKQNVEENVRQYLKLKDFGDPFGLQEDYSNDSKTQATSSLSA